MVRIQELVAGDALVIYMRMGYALETFRLPNGQVIRQPPAKAQSASAIGLSRFRAQVISNNPTTKEIFLHTITVDHKGEPMGGAQFLQATIPYRLFSRVMLISQVAYPGNTEPQRTGHGYAPTAKYAHGLERRPYRTLVQVVL